MTAYLIHPPIAQQPTKKWKGSGSLRSIKTLTGDIRYLDQICENFSLGSLSLQDVFDKVSEESGLKIANLLDGQRIFDTLKIQSENHYEWPVWVKNVYPQLSQICDLTFELEYSTKLIKRLRTGKKYLAFLLFLIRYSSLKVYFLKKFKITYNQLLIKALKNWLPR